MSHVLVSCEVWCVQARAVQQGQVVRWVARWVVRWGIRWAVRVAGAVAGTDGWVRVGDG